MKLYRFVLPLLLTVGFFVAGVATAHAESTIACPEGTYDVLDWMTMDSSMRRLGHLSGSANPLFTDIQHDKFYWTKGGNGYPWDIQLYDHDFVYLWITEYAWNDPRSFKKFLDNKNMPLAARCAKGGFPGSRIRVRNSRYAIYTNCHDYTIHTLRNVVNEVWGPYRYSLGGNLPKGLPVLVLSYRYNCNDNFNQCKDKEEFYLAQKYGLVQWAHYSLIEGSYQQQQKSVFNKLRAGGSKPKFQCF